LLPSLRALDHCIQQRNVFWVDSTTDPLERDGEILIELENAIDLRRTALPRHQTLRATLDWSYELLPETERRLLRRLAIFAAGFTLEAATAVMIDTDDTAFVVLEGVANLVAKSLVALDPRVPSGRWMLLEMIRAYTFEKLVQSGEAEATAQRYAMFYRDIVEPVGGSRSQLPIEELVRDAREIDNVCAALDWAYSPLGDPATGVILTALYMAMCLPSSLMPWKHRAPDGETWSRIESQRTKMRQPIPDGGRTNVFRPQPGGLPSPMTTVVSVTPIPCSDPSRRFDCTDGARWSISCAALRTPRATLLLDLLSPLLD
jgi:hypothetical protein